MLRKKMSLAVLLVGAVVLGSIGTASASSCAPLVGTWLVDTKSTVPVLRPVTFTVHSGGTMSNVSGSNIVVLGFTARSGLHGECSNIGPRLYRVMLEELLYKDGLFAGRFLLDLTVEHDPRTDTIAGVSGQSRFKITVFRTTPPPGPPAPCISSTGDLPAGDMVREDGNERVCRSANDLELTGRHIATDSFFTP
jgi:hypothetical protein